jgi:peptidoglycan/LPS O-acetylase OafA/YrhL
LRGFAAIWVAFFHHYAQVFLGSTYPPDANLFPVFRGTSWIQQFCAQGSSAVQFFWMLSGFVFYMAYSKPISEKKINLQKFCVWRFSRLYPLFLLSTGIIVVYQTYLYLRYREFAPMAAQFSVELLLKNLTFVSAIMSEGHLNSPAWSVSLELLGYLIFFIIARYSLKRKWLYVIPIAFGWAVARTGWNIPFFNRLTAMMFMCFFIGCLVCMLNDAIQTNKRVIAGIIAFFPAVLIPYLAYRSPTFLGDYLSCEIFLGFPALLITAVNLFPLNRILSLKVFKWLGDISFSVYLIHAPVMIILLNSIRLTANIDWSSTYVWFILVAVILGLGTVSHYLFELPMQRLIRKKYTEWRSKVEISA